LERSEGRGRQSRKQASGSAWSEKKTRLSSVRGRGRYRHHRQAASPRCRRRRRRCRRSSCGCSSRPPWRREENQQEHHTRSRRARRGAELSGLNKKGTRLPLPPRGPNARARLAPSRVANVGSGARTLAAGGRVPPLSCPRGAGRGGGFGGAAGKGKRCEGPERGEGIAGMRCGTRGFRQPRNYSRLGGWGGGLLLIARGRGSDWLAEEGGSQSGRGVRRRAGLCLSSCWGHPPSDSLGHVQWCLIRGFLRCFRRLFAKRS
jgi:hypothetical protein